MRTASTVKSTTRQKPQIAVSAFSSPTTARGTHGQLTRGGIAVGNPEWQRAERRSVESPDTNFACRADIRCLDHCSAVPAAAGAS